MPDPLTVGGPFGRTLQDLFLASPVTGQAPRVVGTTRVEVEVPRVSGPAVQLEDARKTLRDARLVPDVRFFETPGPENIVKQQNPDAGKFLPPGAQVTLHVSKPRELTPQDQMLAQLSTAIRNEGLAKAADVTAAVAGLAKTAEVTAEFKAVMTAIAALEQGEEAQKRFEALMNKK